MKRLIYALVLPVLAGLSCVALAQTVPQQMNFQGLLVDSADQPLEGNYDVAFRVYDQASGDTLKWGPQTNAVVVYQGQFNTVLGPTDADGRALIDAFLGSSCFLEIQVGANNPIQPRQQILSAPFALNSSLLDGQGWEVVFDNGDPSTGKIPGDKLANTSVGSVQLAAGAVTTEKLAPDAVSTSTIVDGGVTSADILDGTVTSSDIQNATITSADIGANAVTSSALAPNSVNSSAIVDSTITSADIAPNTITASDVATGAVTSDEILNGTVTSADIADGTVQQADVGTLYRLSANDGNPVSALYVDASGNVGVGTTTPDHRLRVNGHVGIYDSGGAPRLDFVGTVADPYADRAARLYLEQRSGPDRLRLENGAYLALDAMPTVSSVTYHVGWDSSGLLVRESSSRRYKENIRPAEEDFEKILRVEPKTFNYKSAPDGPAVLGYIAEELDEAGLNAVTVYDQEGRPDAVDYSRLVIYSNEILKKHQATIQEQQYRIDALQAEVEALKETVKSLTVVH